MIRPRKPKQTAFEVAFAAMAVRAIESVRTLPNRERLGITPEILADLGSDVAAVIAEAYFDAAPELRGLRDAEVPA